MTTWIWVADASQARLFADQAKDGKLDELENIADPYARMHNGELTGDRLPRTREFVGSARHAIEPSTSANEKVNLEFARELAVLLERGRVNHAYDVLVIVAAPSFLDLLCATIGHKVSKLLVKLNSKNITWSTSEDIRGIVDKSV